MSNGSDRTPGIGLALTDAALRRDLLSAEARAGRWPVPEHAL